MERSDRSSISHSHTTTTERPRARSLLIFSASRFRLSRNFCSQYGRFRLGTVARGQLVWWCQKQPITNIAQPRFTLAKSGEPGRVRTLRR